jgi:hypothetical protein
MARKTQKLGKCEMHTVGPGVCRDNGKSWKMRKTHCKTWNVARNTEKHEKWEMNLKYGGKTENHGKWETHTVGPGIRRETLKNVKNDKQKL